MNDRITSNIPHEVIAEMRWQQSPLLRAITGVVKAAQRRHDKGSKIGANIATLGVVGAADELAEIYAEIMAGERDGLGYPL